MKNLFIFCLPFFLGCTMRNPYVLAPVDGGYDLVKFQEVSWDKRQIIIGCYCGSQNLVLFYEGNLLVKKEQVFWFAPMKDPQGNFMLYEKFGNDTIYIVSPEGVMYDTRIKKK
ncbi:MAG: hypothetical protein ACK4FA_00565 [Candidatus Paceibacteria bacterium]